MTAERITTQHTPSTDTVRGIYVWDRCVKHGRDDSLDTRIFHAEFDRWLAQVIAEAEVRGAREALLGFVQVIEQACPHEDEHPEGACEVCDFVFALEDEASARAEQAGGDRG